MKRVCKEVKQAKACGCMKKKAILMTIMMMVMMSVACLAHPKHYTYLVSERDVFTGLVVDCRGLNMTKGKSPLIYTARGQVIYGDKIGDYQNVAMKGMVKYAKTSDDDDIFLSAAGDNPMWVHAMAISQSRPSSPIVAQEVADLVLFANKRGHFLEKHAVVFIVDPNWKPKRR